jgi:hypothetical protein
VTPSLQGAVENIYNAFRDVPKPTSVDGCPCCIDKKGISILLAKRLRELSPDDLTHYAASAFLTVGAVEDYLYFLPRILEILVSERFWWPHPEVVTRAVNNAGFHSWPDHRQNALKRYFDEVIEELLGRKGSGSDLDSWVCALGKLGFELAPFLVRISANSQRLVEFYEINSQPLVDGRLANGFWDDIPERQKEVIEWLQSADTQRLIMAQYGLA